MDPRYIQLLAPLVQGAINTMKTVPSFKERLGMRLPPYSKNDLDVTWSNYAAMHNYPEETNRLMNGEIRDMREALKNNGPQDMNLFTFDPQSFTSYLESDATTGATAEELMDDIAQFTTNMANNGDNMIGVGTKVSPILSKLQPGSYFTDPKARSIQAITDTFRTLY